MRWDAPPATLPPEPAPGTGPLAARRTDPLAAPTILEAGEKVDRYEVEGVLGSGGMATVYRVRHRTLGSLHALKVLRGTRPELQARLLSEGQMQARLRHPNIVQVLDAFEVKGAPALLMELVEGPSMASWLEHRRLEGPCPLPLVTDIIRGVAQAIAQAHAQGIVHRDLKPGNVLMARQGNDWLPRVTDFGIARYLYDEMGPENLTRTGVVLGTPAYMAPEQFRHGARVDLRADLFALGVLLYELCCGSRPFASPDLVSLLNAIVRADYIPAEVLRPDLTPALRSAIGACLRADPASRIPDCESLLRLLSGERIALPPVSLPPAPKPDVEAGALDSTSGEPPSLEQPAAHSAEQESTTSESLHRLPPQPPRPSMAELDTTDMARAIHPPSAPRRSLLVLGLSGVLVVLLMLGAWVYRTQVRLEVAELTALAWQIQQTQPAQALALLRAASAQAGLDDTSRQLSITTLERLVRQGAASKVMPMDAQVLAVARSSDGSRVAAGLMGGDVVMSNAETGEVLFRTPAGVGHRIGKLIFSPDDKALAAVPNRGVHGQPEPLPARTLSAETGQVLYTFAHGDTTSDFAFSPNGRFAVTLGDDSRIHLWNLENGALVRTLTTSNQTSHDCLASSSDGHWMAVGLINARVQLMSLRDPAEDRLLTLDSASENSLCRVAFSEDNQTIVLNKSDEIIRFNLRDFTGERVPGPDTMMEDVSYSAGLVALRTQSSTVQLRTFPALKPLRMLERPEAGIGEARFSPDGRWLTARTSDAELMAWDVARRMPHFYLLGHTSRVLDFTTEGANAQGALLSGSRDNTMRLWQFPETDTLRHTIPDLESGQIQFMRLSQRGGQLGLFAEDRRARVVNFSSGADSKSLSRVQSLLLPDAPRLESMAISPDGSRIALFGSDHRLRILARPPDSQTELTLVKESIANVWIRWMAFSPDGQWVTLFGDMPDLVLVNADPASPPALIRLPSLAYKVAYSSDSRQLFVGSRKGDVLTIALATAEVTNSIHPAGFVDGISALISTGQDDQLLLGGWLGDFCLWDAKNHREILRFDGHSDAVVGAGASADGRFIGSIGWDRTVRLWDARTGALLKILATLPSDPTNLLLSPDGQSLAVGTKEGKVWLWAIPSGELLGTRQAAGAVIDLRFLPEEQTVRILDSEGMVSDWKRPAPRTAQETLHRSGQLTNYRVCQRSHTVVPVIPFPPAESVWAPPEFCE